MYGHLATVLNNYLIIKFSARGTDFSIPKKLLENFPESMLCIISNTNENIPINKINECIYVDINTFSIHNYRLL